MNFLELKVLVWSAEESINPYIYLAYRPVFDMHNVIRYFLRLEI
jgi:hypothetical protein